MNASALLDRGRTALLVVDLQEKLLPAILDRDRVLQRSLLLMHAARELELPVILTTQYQKGLGATVPEVLAAAGGAEPLDKTSFGCFGDPGFRARLQALGRDQLVVAGIEAHICVAQTVLAGLHSGLAVHVATDAVGSRQAADRDVGLRRMEAAGAVLSSAEMAVYELLERSDGAAFKRLLPFLR
jgi:nicotinamidase-related amidase